MFGSNEYEEQAFNGRLALLRLSNRYSAERLERACAMSLDSGKRSPRHRDVKPILERGQDLAAADAGGGGGEAADGGGYVRGADFYGKG